MFLSIQLKSIKNVFKDKILCIKIIFICLSVKNSLFLLNKHNNATYVRSSSFLIQF
jgi:hypothetical protein